MIQIFVPTGTLTAELVTDDAGRGTIESTHYPFQCSAGVVGSSYFSSDGRSEQSGPQCSRACVRAYLGRTMN